MRYKGLDVLKCICAFLVVCIHARFPGIFGNYFLVITRAAVPVFFMISGFFYEKLAAKNNVWKKILQILTMFIGANIIYFLFDFAVSVFSGNSIYDRLRLNITFKKLIEGLFFNASFFGEHLWYLSAICYVMIVISLLRRRIPWKIWYCITPVLLAVDLVFGKYSIVCFGREFPIIYIRNFLFVGIPYFVIGHFISEKEELVQKISGKLLVAGIVFFICVGCFEKFVLISNGVNAVRDHYISTTFLAVCEFLFFLNYASVQSVVGEVLSKIGRNYSTIIYIMHPMIMTVCYIGFKILKIENVYMIICPIIVFLITLIFTWCYKYAVNKLKIKNKYLAFIVRGEEK